MEPEAPTPLDIDSFAEFHLEATLDYQRLSLDGSILGNNALSYSPNSRLRFTFAHECAHLILHRHIYYRDPSMRCATGTGYRPFSTTTEGVRTDKVDRAEFPANYLGAALLMPRRLFSQAFAELVPQGWYTLNDKEKHAVINNLAGTFGVSKNATAIRIKNLELVT